MTGDALVRRLWPVVGLLLTGGLPAARGAAEPPGVEPLALTCTISVPAQPRRISPDIYGVAGAPLHMLTNACMPLTRWGGNTACRYNWRLGNVWNTGSDWFFENVAVEPQAWRKFLEGAERSGCRALVTLPLIGFVAKDAQSCSFSVRKYGSQQKADPYRPDAGNGVRPDGSPLTGNNRADASVVADPAFVAEWIAQMRKEFPRLFAERRMLFALGNEPMLWNVTHRDVHPDPVSYDEYLERFTAMARAVRQAAPEAAIVGPELWGWPAYFQSALDRDTKSSRDRQRHNGEEFLPWFLRQIRERERQTGERLLDVVTVHFYPQADGVRSDSIDSRATALRVETVRSLYDPTYRDPSWINDRVELIPRLRRWVAQCCPGLKIGITEYNWGGEDDISGAMALADILGVYGREGLDLACYWMYPKPGSPAALAYALYRNVDGAGAAFGDQGLDVTLGGAPEARANVSLYAARSATPPVVTIVAINKSALPRAVRLSCKGIAIAAGTRYSITAVTNAIQPMVPLPPVRDGAVQLVLAPRSVCHLRFPEQP